MRYSDNFIPRHKRTPQDNGWQLTLADMMTLILCFFVIIVAVSKVDQNKYEAISEVLAEAMKSKEAVERLKGETIADPTERKTKNLFELQLELAKLIGKDATGVELKLRPDAVAVNLRGGVFFQIGSANLTQQAVTMLDRLADPLTGANYKLTIEGHSDNLPMHSAQFPSNWELSSARASSVARFLIDRGFPKDRIRVMGLADTQPLVPNTDGSGKDIPENQAKNRRVTLLVRPAN